MKNWILKAIGFIHGGVLMTSICMNVILGLIIALMHEDKKKEKENPWHSYSGYYNGKK